MFSINCKSSPILPIRVINEPQSDLHGLRVSPFSAIENNLDEAAGKRLATRDTDAQNILSPAALIASVENDSPQDAMKARNQKIMLLYPTKYDKEAKSQLRNSQNIQDRHNAIFEPSFPEMPPHIDQFACQNQVSGSTKPHTAKRSPEIVLGDKGDRNNNIS